MSSRWERNFHDYSGLPNSNKIVPNLFNNEVLENRKPGLQRAVRMIIHDVEFSRILGDGFNIVSGDATALNITGGFIFVIDDEDLSKITEVSPTGPHNITSSGHVLVIDYTGTVSVKAIASISTYDVPLYGRVEGSTSTIDLRTIKKGNERIFSRAIDAIFGRNVNIGGTLSISGGMGGDLDLNFNNIVDVATVNTRNIADPDTTSIDMQDNIHMIGNDINMNSGGGSGGGDINMDQGDINMDQGDINMDQGNINNIASIDGGGSDVDINDILDMTGNNIQMNGGTGSGGGDVVMDSGDIVDCDQANVVTVAAAPPATSVAFANNVNMQGNNIINLNTVNGKEYYCTTQAGITAAITAIGVGEGKIILLNDITLTSTININTGGEIHITSTGRITLSTAAGTSAFNISNCASFILENVVISASVDTTATTYVMNVSSSSASRVTILNVNIDGNPGSFSNITGIYIASGVSNVNIDNCRFRYMSRGIDTNGNYTSITDSRFDIMNANSGRSTFCIDLNSVGNVVNGCIFNNVDAPTTYDAVGIRVNNTQNMVKGCYIYDITATGTGGDAIGIWITINGNNIAIVGNYMSTIEANTIGTYAVGIYMEGDWASITGNFFIGMTSSAGTAAGMYQLTTGSYCTFTGNMSRNNILMAGDNNAISGNVINANLTIAATADNNIVTSNRLTTYTDNNPTSTHDTYTSNDPANEIG